MILKAADLTSSIFYDAQTNPNDTHLKKAIEAFQEGKHDGGIDGGIGGDGECGTLIEIQSTEHILNELAVDSMVRTEKDQNMLFIL